MVRLEVMSSARGVRRAAAGLVVLGGLSAASLTPAACSSFGDAESEGVDGGVDAVATTDAAQPPDASVEGGSAKCTPNLLDDFERDVVENGTWRVNPSARTTIATSTESPKSAQRSLRIDVRTVDPGAGSGAGHLRRDLDHDCARVRFWLRVPSPPTGDLFVVLLSAPREGADGGSGPGANVDFRVLVNDRREIFFAEQISGGIDYVEYAKASIADGAYHLVDLQITSSGPTLGVRIALDEQEIALARPPQARPKGRLRTLILGPSFAQTRTAATLLYDDFELY